MSVTEFPYGHKTQHTPRIAELHILWITAGLSCDGDSVSITAASEPSIEDILLGAVPGLPKVHLHNAVLAYEVGDDFMRSFHQASRDELGDFVLVVEGSIPNENLSGEGYWAAMGTDPDTGQPITTNDWIDRLAPNALAVIAAGTCATYGGIHAMKGNPTGHGDRRLPRLGLEVEGRPSDRQCAGMPSATRQFHGNLALFAPPARGARANDPA
jgi:hydrogenase small subunit